MRALALSLLLSLASAGCTLEDGTGFAVLSARLDCSFAGVQPGNSRLLSDGWFKTADSFELKFDKLTLKVRDLRLQSTGASSSSSAGGSCTFDPANPPAGCSLCHGGHCHCDGKLVSYTELKALACGGGSTGSTLVTLERLLVTRDQELLGAGTKNEDLVCAGSCELKRGSASQVSVLLDKLTMAAQVRDRSVANRLAGKTYKITLDWDLAGASLGHKFSSALGLDRDNPYMLGLSVKLPVTEALLDGIEWHKLSVTGDTITVDTTNNKTAGQTMASSLANTTLLVVVIRDDD